MNKAHICIVQPVAYVHSLGFLNQGMYLQHHLQGLGLAVSMEKNRLRRDAVNFVLGAHLGFDAALQAQYPCVIVNLEQLGEGGLDAGTQYLRLLKESAVVDYHAANVPSYSDGKSDVPLLSIGPAPYLENGMPPVPLEARPIDIFFFGSMNDRRRQAIDRIERCGVQVAAFDSAVYGPELDEYIRQAKCVINLHFYDAARFEQSRASLVMSNGTPLISERNKEPGAVYKDSVLWFDPARPEKFFGGYFKSEAFYADARAALARFRQHDPRPNIERIWQFGLTHQAAWAQRHAATADAPRRLSRMLRADGYRHHWINVDHDAALRPDWRVDLNEPLALPHLVDTPAWGELSLTEACLKAIDAGVVEGSAEHAAAFMNNCLNLLEVGGTLSFELALDGRASSVAPQVHVQNWLLPFTQKYWRSAWLAHRFERRHIGYCAHDGSATSAEDARRMRVVLVKVQATLQERMLARAAREDFGMPELLGL